MAFNGVWQFLAFSKGSTAQQGTKQWGSQNYSPDTGIQQEDSRGAEDQLHWWQNTHSESSWYRAPHGAIPKIATETVTHAYMPLRIHHFTKNAAWTTHCRFIKQYFLSHKQISEMRGWNLQYRETSPLFTVFSFSLDLWLSVRPHWTCLYMNYTSRFHLQLMDKNMHPGIWFFILT